MIDYEVVLTISYVVLSLAFFFVLALLERFYEVNEYLLKKLNESNESENISND